MGVDDDFGVEGGVGGEGSHDGVPGAAVVGGELVEREEEVGGCGRRGGEGGEEERLHGFVLVGCE